MSTTSSQQPESQSAPIGAQSDLLQMLLDDQQQLSAVEQFSQSHDLLEEREAPDQKQYYESLLPTSPLEAGEQYAFQVDLSKCSGCKACVTACHSLNGLDETEAWRDVGLLHNETNAVDDLPIVQHVTTACHHCLEPACMSGCPTDAYEKDPITGIVKHLDDQCFGCQYCTLTCPYGVPKYHESKGIVRKCDMCTQRLSNGEAPACVQSCPHEAIAITKVAVDDIQTAATNNDFLTTAPDPDYTKPTTQYLNRDRLPETIQRADAYELVPEHAHLPLFSMLTLIQFGIGGFISTMAFPSEAIFEKVVIGSLSLVLTLTALAASTFHLGRPFLFFRAVIGFRHSWLSREALVFGAYSGACQAYLGMLALPLLKPFGLPIVSDLELPAFMTTGAGLATAISGLLGVFCSMMIYAVTRRPFWSMSQTSFRFFTTTVLGMSSLGLLGISLLPLFDSPTSPFVMMLFAGITVAVAVLKFVVETNFLKRAQTDNWESLDRSARILTTALKQTVSYRFTLLTVCGMLLPLLAVGGGMIHSMLPVAFSALCFSGLLVAELIERFQFFAAVIAPKMPRGVR